jgi:hypothetical protein
MIFLEITYEHTSAMRYRLALIRQDGLRGPAGLGLEAQSRMSGLSGFAVVLSPSSELHLARIGSEFRSPVDITNSIFAARFSENARETIAAATMTAELHRGAGSSAALGWVSRKRVRRRAG